MPTVTRLETGESYAERAVPSEATVRYKVLGAYTGESAVSAVKAEFGPTGTVHLEDQTGRLKSYQYVAVERVGAGSDRGWLVDVMFSLDSGGASFETPPVTEPDYATAEFNDLEKTIKAPYFFKVPTQYESGGSIATSFDWNSGVQDFVIAGLAFRAVVNVPASEYNFAAFDSARLQKNKIHTFGGVKWQYLGATSSQIASDVWKITHEWWNDPGNDAPPIPIGSNASDIINAPARAPFEDYAKYVDPVVGPVLGPTYEPVVSVYSPYVEDPSGYTGLIGDPIGRVT